MEEEEKELYLREANVMAELSHPNIITSYKYFIENQFLHILMEYAESSLIYNNLRWGSSEKNRSSKENRSSI